MNKTSATTNGLKTIELVAALTSLQLSELEAFAEKRLRRAAGAPERQRAMSLHCGRSLLHTAIERFALGDAGFPGGRRLRPHQRVDAAAFCHALRGAINSLVQHAFDSPEFESPHLSVASGAEGKEFHDPLEPGSLPDQLEVRDLEANLFDRLTADAGHDQRLQAAVASLREDCTTGHVMGVKGDGVDAEAKRVVREQARQEWENLTL
jgi:hypothetical protein